ncbi:MAG: adaptor protein MecA [Lachnospiraceae bacterium]|nr:adaptor protein MecA [Lachnospiraceae bacterium]
MLSEYGASSKYTISNEAYMKEHFSILLPAKALQSLCEV